MRADRWTTHIFLATLICIAAACAPPPPPRQPVTADAPIDRAKLADLTRTFDETTIYWPTNHPFRLTRMAWGRSPGGWWYASNDYAASEHGGTHMDAPIHFHEGGWTVDAIPLDRLVARAVVVDVSAKCAADADYAATESDVRDWEAANGPIPDGAIVVLRTGWGERWPDRARYLGTAGPGDVAHLHFPGFSEGAARYLAGSGKLVGIGLDTASLDPGVSKTFVAHQVFSAANLYGLENLAALEKLPAKGATLIALPMKIGGGTGGPTRVVAILP